MTTWMRHNGVSLALAGAVAAALVWYVLASATGLIFHFMPAAPTLVAAWIVRWADHQPPSRGRRAGLLVLGASVALATTVVLATQGRPLDEPPLTALALAGGVGIGVWVLRTPRVPDVRHHTVDRT